MVNKNDLFDNQIFLMSRKDVKRAHRELSRLAKEQRYDSGRDRTVSNCDRQINGLVGENERPNSK